MQPESNVITMRQASKKGMFKTPNRPKNQDVRSREHLFESEADCEAWPKGEERSDPLRQRSHSRRHPGTRSKRSRGIHVMGRLQL